MTSIRIIVAAIALMTSGVVTASAGDTKARAPQCTHTFSQYSEAIRILESEAADAKAMAVSNPLYESDLGYYASALADARQCLRVLAPVASR